MKTNRYDRRSVLGMLAATAAAVGPMTAPRLAHAEDRDATIAAAKRESGLVWYDHYDQKASRDLMLAFKKAYPFVKQVEFVDVPASQKQAKVVQESMAGGPTTDVIFSGPQDLKSLYDRDLLLRADWKALGVQTSDVMTPETYMILVTTAVTVVLYNTNMVKPEEVPHTWEEAFAAKWKGRIGHWSRTVTFLELIPALGEAKVEALVQQLAFLRPRLFGGLYPVAEAVASGEIAQAEAAYDDYIRIHAKGAPVGMAVIEPIPFAQIYGGVLKYGKNPNTARLFLAWLASPEGAKAFEDQTKRGNAFVQGTLASQVVKGHKLSYLPAEQAIAEAKKLTALEAKFSREIAGR